MAAKRIFSPLFVSHGAPTLVIEKENPSNHFLKVLGKRIGKPKAVLVVSAHWETNHDLKITTSNEQLYDFYGFPDELYRLTYRPPKNPTLLEALANKASNLITASTKIKCEVVHDRPLDHGTWVPLYLMYPEADVPVIQLSINRNLDLAYHLSIGQALRPLIEEDEVLLLSSGGSSHNFALFRGHDPKLSEETKQFEAWLDKTISLPSEERNKQLLDFNSHPLRKAAHPREEHFVPIAVCSAAASGVGKKLVELEGHQPYYFMSNFEFFTN